MNRCVLRRQRNVANDSADVTSSERSFQICGPVGDRKSSATNSRQSLALIKRLLPTERSDRNGGIACQRARDLVGSPQVIGQSRTRSLIQH